MQVYSRPEVIERRRKSRVQKVSNKSNVIRRHVFSVDVESVVQNFDLVVQCNLDAQME